VKNWLFFTEVNPNCNEFGKIIMIAAGSLVIVKKKNNFSKISDFMVEIRWG
jgi:hypothetical protein